MVRTRKTLERHDFAGKRTQAPLHAVANHGSADLPCDGETDAHRRVLILALTDKQHETGRSRAAPRVRGEEICPLLERG
jgi:hypothetical protein